MIVSIGGSPQPKQQEFLQSTARFTGYGGARGGGKSWAVRAKAILLSSNYAGIRILLLRRTFPELNENHVRPLKKLLHVRKGRTKHGEVSYNATEKAFEFPNGSVLKLGYLDSDSDVDQYQGQEYDVIFLDEATHFTEYMFNTLKACLRGANSFPKRMYLTCNPGSIGHVWVKRLFVDRQFKADENPDDYLFIPAKVYDNAILIATDVGYVNMLQSLPEGLKRAWLHGDWNVFEGQYFPEFNVDLHVIKPFVIPKHWRRYTTMDYGLDMLAHYDIRVDEHGNVFVVNEIHESGLIVSEAAQRIIEQEELIVAKGTIRLAPPDLWNRQSMTGKSTAELFRECGLNLRKSNNDRVAGWLAIHELLKGSKKKDGSMTSRLKIFENCFNLIRTLPLLQFDDKNPNDVSKEPHEITHAPDALRYFAIGWTMSAEQEQTEKKNSLPYALREDNENKEDSYFYG